MRGRGTAQVCCDLARGVPRHLVAHASSVGRGPRRMALHQPIAQPPVEATIPAEKPAAKIWEAEKDEARRIQESLLPTGSLSGPSFEIACRFAPFSDVSGDFADYFDLPNVLVGI